MICLSFYVIYSITILYGIFRCKKLLIIIIIIIINYNNIIVWLKSIKIKQGGNVKHLKLPSRYANINNIIVITKLIIYCYNFIQLKNCSRH